MNKVYSVEVIIKSNADLNAFHGILTETLIPTMRSYHKNEAIKAAIKSLEMLLEPKNDSED